MSQPSSRPPRSFGGLVGAMVVTLVAITAFVGWRALNRDDLEVEPEPVDYLGAVRAVQDAGDQVVYPPRLPAGWVVTSAEYRPGDEPTWAVGALTDAGDFAGLRQERTSPDELVETYVDEDATEGDQVTLDSQVAGSWRSFTDANGDYALLAETGQAVVLVYGDAPAPQLRALAASLTRDPLADSADSADSADAG